MLLGRSDLQLHTYPKPMFRASRPSVTSRTHCGIESIPKASPVALDCVHVQCFADAGGSCNGTCCPYTDMHCMADLATLRLQAGQALHTT